MAKALVPFVFVYQPAMLIATKGFTLPSFLLVTGFCIVSITFLAAGLTGFMRASMAVWERAACIGGAVFMMAPGWLARLIGLALIIPVFLKQFGWASRRAAMPG
jgi:TRAP-type uncharacterized transport system fused permease subunit